MRRPYNFALLKARNLFVRRELDVAERAFRDLIARSPGSSIANLMLAETYLVADELDAALDQLRISKNVVAASTRLKDRDRRYLNAYIEFRITATECRRANEEFENWQAIAHDINTLPKNPWLKSFFLLPEDWEASA